MFDPSVKSYIRLRLGLFRAYKDILPIIFEKQLQRNGNDWTPGLYGGDLL